MLHPGERKSYPMLVQRGHLVAVLVEDIQDAREYDYVHAVREEVTRKQHFLYSDQADVTYLEK